ncbi:hypothetical protein N0B31_03630 [Salinirubellus salinus]|uniref:Uncharacterized protein n=1 Tax=Salinirubellus salinus TaxID=1364945 RepID=A0A9E7U5H1_9EURY|nr:hypothetical protein [Salinirubellus salinus]UWM55380.1 hypothetical protein N0B31_03630 [Salinirubellus salinus]
MAPPWLLALVGYSVLPVGITVTLWATAPSPWSSTLWVAMGFGLLFNVVASVLVWYYDTTVLPGFFDEVRELVVEESMADVERLAARHQRFFARRWAYTAVPWTVLILTTAVLATDFQRALGVAGAGDPVYPIYLAYYLWGGLLTGVGFHGMLTTVRCIREFTDAVDLRIDPLHPDGLGGLGAFGFLAIRTTLLTSLGALLLPMGFEMAAGQRLEWLVGSAILLYTVFIAGTFAYPTFRVHKVADRLREAELNRLRAEIRGLPGQLSAAGDGDTAAVDNRELAVQLEIQRLRREYREYADVKLYPMSVSILAQLVGSVLLPLFFLLLDLALSRVL